MRPRAIVGHGTFLGLLCATAAGMALSRFLNFHPRAEQEEPCQNQPEAPALSPERTIKVVTYNTQFLAGTNYDFFYDGGTDSLVNPADVLKTAAGISAFLTRENPDFILLQEVDCGARRTAYLDQIELLMNLLPKELRNYANTYYWKSRFVPHPKIMGPAGTKLAIFSRYRLGKAMRYRLAHTPANPVVKDFHFKRAILQVDVPLTDGKTFCLLNTHLEAFPKGTRIMKRQVDQILSRLDFLDQKGLPWLIGGDFNLLPPAQWTRLNIEQRGCHHHPSEISAIYQRYHGVPMIADASEEQMRRFMTFTKRIGSDRTPIRTLDYFFASPQTKIRRYAVRQEGVKHLSDHLPLVAEFSLPHPA
jgi:endonuclease/exonuclease/phosphatase family metal-dependent hydrolase